MNAEGLQLNLGIVAAIIASVAGVVVWGLTFFAWERHTSKKFTEHDQKMSEIDHHLSGIKDDLQYIKGMVSRKNG